MNTFFLSVLGDLYPNSPQPAQTAEGPVGSHTKGGGSHLLHQLPRCRGREAAENNQGKCTPYTNARLVKITLFLSGSKLPLTAGQNKFP